LITDSDRLLEDEALRVRMIEEYQRFPCIEIDTTGLIADQVVEEILAALRNEQRGRQGCELSTQNPA
jgi:broad-specificity NMP kinase